MSLADLEKRLKQEPTNLGLRVTVAGAYREVGRHIEAIELYRSVAIAYRDQGRSQQAIAVCKSILEIAPNDVPCQELLATLAPTRRSSFEDTPLPGHLPYHVADPTTHSLKKQSDVDLDRPSEQGMTMGEMKTIAPVDVSESLETRKRPRIDTADVQKIDHPPPEFDDENQPTGIRDSSSAIPDTRDTEEEVTVPREAPDVKR